MRELRLAGRIIWTQLKNSLYYPQRVLLDCCGMTARCGILLLLYKGVFAWKGGQINHTPYQIVAWSIFLYFVFSVMRARGVTDEITEDVRTGRLEMLLCKPVHYLTYRFWQSIGAGLSSFLTIAPIGFSVMILTLGIPPSMRLPIFLETWLLVAVLGTILTFLIRAIIGIMSFWMEDVDPIYWIVDKFIVILGGSFLPVAFFPPIMYRLSLYSPFGASQFISHTVYDSWAGMAWWMVGMQVFWIAIALGILLWIYQNAKRQVSINGG
jgi:ABC-2 type transport system permease protein